jgi:hypothetical protein
MFKKILIISGIILCIAVLGLYILLRRAYQSGAIQEAVVQRVTDELAKKTPSSTPDSTLDQGNLIRTMLGFDGVKTYLVLLLNNTELRPGGGFIGSYAVVSVDKGVPTIHKVEGTEILDYSGYPEDFPSIPPDAIKTYLKVPRWYFRDANWSPDFASSAVKVLDLYQKERGLKADSISGVIGVTATTVEELLKITGPVTVQNETFTSDNAVEKLEYEVEIAFEQKGIDRAARKHILGDLVKEVVKKLTTDAFVHWKEYFALAQTLLNEKMVIIFANNQAVQSILEAKRWSGTIVPYQGGDFLLWADANLGALKTDAVLERSLSYTIQPVSSTYVGTVTMQYAHRGGRDWKTSRYLTYARVYLPPGTRVLSTQGIEKNASGKVTTTPDHGVEFGREWFGGFASIDPGTVGKVSFMFELAPTIQQDIKNGLYYAFFQKQLGTKNHALTLNLDFGRKVVS